ncbi:hypothetical protein STPH1_7486 [Streptomyces sp. OM5714]|nr:hypothetical protein STPH1_7486 [Streptomyces sp. OM5714]
MEGGLAQIDVIRRARWTLVPDRDGDNTTLVGDFDGHAAAQIVCVRVGSGPKLMGDCDEVLDGRVDVCAAGALPCVVVPGDLTRRGLLAHRGRGRGLAEAVRRSCYGTQQSTNQHGRHYTAFQNWLHAFCVSFGGGGLGENPLFEGRLTSRPDNGTASASVQSWRRSVPHRAAMK